MSCIQEHIIRYCNLAASELYYIRKIEQRPFGCKDRNVRLWGYIREWGQNPRINQYRGHRDPHPLAKASHWGNLRRQGVESFEVRVGRTTVIDGIFAKNGYGDVLPFFGA